MKCLWHKTYMSMILILVVFYQANLLAVDPAPGSACSTNNARMRSGGPENSGVVYDMTCQGGVWVGSMSYATSGSVGIGTTSPTAGTILDIYGTGTSQSSVLLPRDTTANRPTGVEGMIRYNSTEKAVEVYQGKTPAWGILPSEIAAVDLVSQTAAIAATNIFTPSVDAPVLVCAQVTILTAGTSGNINVAIRYSSESGATSHQETVATTVIGFVGNATRVCGLFYMKSGTALRYLTVFTGTPGPIVYNVHYRVYRMD